MEENKSKEKPRGLSFEEKFEAYNQQLDKTTNWILTQMQATDGKWEMPWHKGIPQAMNPKTGKFYSGNNQALLWRICEENEYIRNKWATFYQWSSVKAKVKKGEKGTLICIAIPLEKSKKNQIGQLDLFDRYSQKNINQKNKFFKFRFKRVFNQNQVNGYFGDQPDIFNPEPDPENLIKALIEKSEADIRQGGEKAFYCPSEDFIQMPELARFQGHFTQVMDSYYSVLLHELIHWTGHNSRCKRSFGREFGNPEYAFEELVAELGSALLSTHLGRKIYPREDHSKYLNNWLKVLKDDFTHFYLAIDLAKYAVYWLFEKTGIYPYDLKKQEPRFINEKRIEDWTKSNDL
jgi:antirestriction protein ArdC